MEWSLLGEEPPTTLYRKFSQWQETPLAFQKQYGPHSSLTFLKAKDERPVAGNYFYVIRFTGDVLFGHELVSYMAGQLNLTILQLLVYLKGQCPPKHLTRRGYKLKQTNGKCSLYKKEINLYLTPDGMYFQVRAKSPREWERISKIVEKEINLLRRNVNFEKKWA
jgi:hypothetical protein